MKRVLPPLAALLLAAGCGAPAHRAPTALAAAERPAVTTAVAARAGALGRAACGAWSHQSRATDVAGVTALRRTAERSASAAARLDPHWSALAKDLADLRALEAAYAKADVYHAFPLAPKLEVLRKRIPTRC